MTTLLDVDRLTKQFSVRGGTVSALEEVSLQIEAGQTLGLVGESGCGKSTLGKTLVRLYEPDAGRILLDGKDISKLDRRALRPMRRDVQMIFQDPYASLNPRSTVLRILTEPMLVHGIGTVAERRERAEWLMQRVGLRPEHAERLPHEFSGGQRQRIGIARALALQPRLIVCDEPVSALDVSVRAQVINLLTDLQQEFGLSYLFVSHDLSVVKHVADRVAVMYLGRIVEIGERRRLWAAPAHPYTRALLASAPVTDPAHRGQSRMLLQGDVPSPLDPPSGCRFRTRCPHATPVCAVAVPELHAVDGDHAVACHQAGSIGPAISQMALKELAS
jgi:oligopeptide/dipeptide ABC transporter ATP-binding protein